ncbi:MAG: hypothetical protein GX088_04210 [Clostridia bacterium]|nr:hypothetical protein [Clostridia bacterium]
MNDIDRLIMEGLLPLKKRAVKSFAQKYPQFMALFEKFFKGQRNKIGIQITEKGEKAAEYTFHIEGTDITEVEKGVLSSELHHPFGIIIRPYFVTERSVLEKAIADKEYIISNPVEAIEKYLPFMILKFM